MMTFIHARRRAFPRLAAVTCLITAMAVLTPSAWAAWRAGAAAVDVTPNFYPIVVNGGFLPAVADRAVDRLYARAIVFNGDGAATALVVVDSCMLPRELIDEAKAAASKATGIDPSRMMVSATHTHSAPSAMGALGTDVVAEYQRYLVPRIAEAVKLAHDRLEPAQAGFAVVKADQHTFCRRWILRPDRIRTDPFGAATVRANMHPGHQNPDFIGPSGPVDADLSLLAVRSTAGRPIALLANYSMHYVGAPAVSSDYFGRFAERFEQRVGGEAKGQGGDKPFVAIMSQGTSGDLQWRDYSQPAKAISADDYAAQLVELAHAAYSTIEYRDVQRSGMAETKVTLKRRVPDEQRLAWARGVLAGMAGRGPQNLTEVYALEQVYLHEQPQRELVLQAIRIGDTAIATFPNEVYGITGLKVKAYSPFKQTFNIELANGSEGYIPPPEQHQLGGYTTWPARTAGLEERAEPVIVEALVTMLEALADKPRRSPPAPSGPMVDAIRAAKPAAYWPLDEIEGFTARDAAGEHDGVYEPGIARYLPGRVGRSQHFAGGRMATNVAGMGDAYSVSLWFNNGLPSDARAVTGYIASRGVEGDEQAGGDHLGIGGTYEAGAYQGRLIFFNGNDLNQVLAGTTIIEPGRWHHAVMVRDGSQVTVYLDGRKEIEGQAGVSVARGVERLFIGGRNDGFAGFEGRIDEAAVFTRALNAGEAAALCAAERGEAESKRLPPDVRVGAAAVNLEADDKMPIAGGILPGYAKGQEGQLRATAVVIEKPDPATARGTKLAIVACDVLFVERSFVDEALAEIEQTMGIPVSHILVNATHTHHAPSVTAVHGYETDPTFRDRVKAGIVQAVREANAKLDGGESSFYFHLGEESTIGGNSRLLLEDGTIWWIGSMQDKVRPTGPFDPQLPVLAFRGGDDKPRALIYNHSTHTIGTRGGNVRSPGFYGLAAQELEQELGGIVCFLEGASGSTHNITGVPTDEAVKRLKAVIHDALGKAQRRPVKQLAAIRRPFTFTVRRFDEAKEDHAVVSYTEKRVGKVHAKPIIEVFRAMRQQLAPRQGEERTTWLQVMAIGDVAIVGVPAEYFTGLGVDIKKRSPFRETYIAELANDWIGYLPDREGHKLGGYQTWMGLHSYAEVGTGERVADEVTAMLNELRKAVGDE